ncbi:signal peptidase I [Salibacterium halotolerans]|uniref:Signal peptidase I n=1 Tax=Salibacterium halotolerans TaxID=1884432 RepID=A0A1I5UJA0_9BACI|nr:signal peptidase I [Salibacterium halotolerans]SFP95364.1 signal peptidase I [Salibacterium halotolerans]
MNTIAREVWDWIKTFAVVVIIVFIIRTFFFANYMVHGESMMPTIENGERLIINKIGYEFSKPDRFDLVVFHANEESDYIKRVIGLPGDRIRYEDDTLYVNGEAVKEEYLAPYRSEAERGPFTSDFTLEEVTGRETVPEGHIFVLGDNRRNSMDSRRIGFVDMDEVVGEANLRYWPVDEFRVMG